ncbi:hypothetical protein AVEN_127170-1 [Araneus ventricosus]|uniref:Uncharacterized protein n=1 Tax=Araneus ventricosus TaxID=182803 RepID=A0A4Y2VZD7_ARAVE|nr:hypothetical protein AVEN_127170-1 [Araneus ventricosus]
MEECCKHKQELEENTVNLLILEVLSRQRRQSFLIPTRVTSIMPTFSGFEIPGFGIRCKVPEVINGGMFGICDLLTSWSRINSRTSCLRNIPRFPNSF